MIDTELEWWLNLAPTLTWRFAKTMPDYPHSYVVKGRTLEAETFDRAVLVIRRFGEPEKFQKSTRIYLTDPETNTKWWTMGDTLDGTTIINQSDADKTYGVQDAPRTVAENPMSLTAAAAHFTQLGPTYNESLSDTGLDDPVRKAIVKHFGPYAPTTLDIGAGTGRLLDWRVTSPKLYTAVDPSQGMLNELIRKYPKLTAEQVIPETAEVYLLREPPSFELVTALGGSAGYLRPDTIATLRFIAKKMLVLTFDQQAPALAPHYATSRQLAHALPDSRTFQHGDFVTVVIEHG